MNAPFATSTLPFPGAGGIHPADLARATGIVDTALKGASAYFIARNRDKMIANELPIARFEREQNEWRKRHGLGRVNKPPACKKIGEDA